MEGFHPSYCVGIDWASDTHAVAGVDARGQLQQTFTVRHTAEGLAELIRRLERIAPAATLPIALERPSGLLVDTLVEHGDSPIALAFLESYPSPEAAAHLGEKRLDRFLKRAAYCGRRGAPELLGRLRAAPLGRAGALESETKGQLVRALVSVLRPLVEQIRELDGLIAGHLAQHPDAAIVQSFPRTGCVNAAQILAELGDDRQRFATFEQLAAEAGVAPVTYTSGKHRGVACRFACNKRLRQALTTWADNSRHAHPWAAAVYRAARQRGCDHPHAVRILARSWVRILWRCWQDRTRYDPARHGRALPFLERPLPSSVAA